MKHAFGNVGKAAVHLRSIRLVELRAVAVLRKVQAVVYRTSIDICIPPIDGAYKSIERATERFHLERVRNRAIAEGIGKDEDRLIGVEVVIALRVPMEELTQY